MVDSIADPGPDARQLTFVGARSSFWRRFARNRGAVVAAAYMVLLVLIAIAAPLVAPYDPNAQTLTAINQAPSAEHLLGTDHLGRDVLTRLMFGARVSLIAGVASVGMALFVALPMALASGYLGGFVDSFFMRTADAVQSFPALVLAVTISAVLGPGLRNATIALAIVFFPTFVRLIRGEVLAVSKETYIEASRSIGTSTPRIITHRVLHNIAPPLIVQGAITMGFALLAEAALSFLGLGVQPPTPSWGRMLASSYTYIYSAGWQIVIIGAVIAMTVFAFNVIADGLRDSFGREIRSD